MNLTKRTFDIAFSATLCILFIWLFLILSIFIKITSKGPIIFWSSRVGKNNIIFNMPKFRSMTTNAPIIATHLMNDSENYLSPIGPFLRRTSLDELPQLFSILKGDMSFVGPRPALFSQDDLIIMRKKQEVDKLTPGLTGLAQIKGRDELSIPQKVQLDIEYMNNKSFLFDLKILWRTLAKVINSDNVSH